MILGSKVHVICETTDRILETGKVTKIDIEKGMVEVEIENTNKVSFVDMFNIQDTGEVY